MSGPFHDHPPVQLPVPDNWTESGELAELLTICRLALRAPEAVGLNETEIAQFCPDDRPLPHVLPWIEKSPGFVPAKVTDEIVIPESPVLVNVITCDMEVLPSSRAANASDEGDRVSVTTPPMPCKWRLVFSCVMASITK